MEKGTTVLSSGARNAYNMHVRVANDSEAIEILFHENFTATAYDLTTLWRYFRLTDNNAVKLFTPPMHNDGSSVKEIPVLTPLQKHLYTITREWFSKYISLCSSNVGAKFILKITTPFGGIYIRKTIAQERQIHSFVTADLPPENICSTMISFECEN